MRLVRITEPSGRDIYINPKHVISIFRGNDGVTVKVSDGKVYTATQQLLDLVGAIETCYLQA